MKIDLRKLYSLNSLNIDSNLEIPKELYSKMGIIRMENTHVNGTINVNYENNIELKLTINGVFIIPCAVSLEEVSVPFSSEVNDIIAEKEENNEFYLDLLDILWENIVLEIPIRVVKEGIEVKNLHGEGWELDTEK
jgi:uncharacterized protein